MSEIPLATNRQTTYENFVAQCPHCGMESIFNRASDLHTFEPIAGLDISCLNVDCGKRFRIVGDSVNNPHEMLILDCYELVQRKHYMNYILTVAQAYEVFFILLFRAELLYKPFAADPNHDLIEMNRLSEELQACNTSAPSGAHSGWPHLVMNPTTPRSSTLVLLRNEVSAV